MNSLNRDHRFWNYLLSGVKRQQIIFAGLFEQLQNRAKNVAVISGGPTGLEAAYELGLKGHHVTLIEKEVVIVGGGMVGCELTVHLQSIGKRVDIVEMEDELMAEAEDLIDEKFLTEFFMTHEYQDRKPS